MELSRLIMLFFLSWVGGIIAETEAPLYFCTSADSRYYPQLLNMIGSIHKVNFADLGEIAVFNLGLEPHQIQHLQTIAKLKICSIERTNPEILKPLPKYPGSRQKVRGLYSWKPVAIKQALDMYPYVMYIDSGIVIIKPFNDVFKHIWQHGHFLVDCGHNIIWMTTKYVINKFDLLSEERKWILDKSTIGLSAGFQGLTRDYYDSYVLPMYELSKNLRNFLDDGTTPNGYKTGRHDQALFSICARLAGMHISRREHGSIEVDGKQIPFHIAEDRVGNPNAWAAIVRRGRAPNFKQFIRYKSLSEN